MKWTHKYSPKRLAWLTLGLFCVVLAAIGAVLPLMPTTVFLLIAAFAFARSSPKLHNWLLAHKIFGKMIRNWQDHGAISRKAKIASLISMGLVLLSALILKLPLWAILVQLVILGVIASFILTRPLPPNPDSKHKSKNSADTL